METANILVCEDERLVARDIEKALLRNGYSVAGIASNCEQALHIVEEMKPNLALMDIRLRGSMSGIDIAGILTEQYGIPSIYLTAYSDEETLEQAKTTMPLSFLLKPFDEQELKTAVEIGLSRYREQMRIVDALQTYVDSLGGADAIANAVEVGREFRETGLKNSLIRVAGKVAAEIHDDLRAVEKLVTPLAYEPALSEEQRCLLTSALTHHRRVQKVVDTLVDCSSPKPLRLEEEPIEGILRESITEAKQFIGHGVEFFERFFPKRLIAAIDREKISRAFFHSLLDAHGRSAEGTPVIVATSSVYEGFPERFNEEATAGWFVVVRILDSGKGFSAEDIEHVFEPCFDSGNDAHGGVERCFIHTVMQQHLGWAHLESTVGMGSILSLYFPMKHPQIQTESAQKLLLGNSSCTEH